jgi:hypothetical protein
MSTQDEGTLIWHNSEVFNMVFRLNYGVLNCETSSIVDVAISSPNTGNNLAYPNEINT